MSRLPSYSVDSRLLEVDSASLTATKRRRFKRMVAAIASTRAAILLNAAGISCEPAAVGRSEIDQIQRWIDGLRLTTPFSPEELQVEHDRVIGNMGEGVGRTVWSVMDKRVFSHVQPEGLQIGVDVALLVACVLRARHPSLKWSVAGSRLRDYDKQVRLVGFKIDRGFKVLADREMWCINLAIESRIHSMWNRLASFDMDVKKRGVPSQLVPEFSVPPTSVAPAAVAGCMSSSSSSPHPQPPAPAS